MTRRRSTLLLAVAALALPALALADLTAPHAAAQTRPAPSSLAEVLRGFREMGGLSASFVEEKQIALLARPVRSEGVLYFAPPGKLMRRVTAPTESAALIDGDTLTFVSEGRREEIPLSSNPVVGGFVASFRTVLAGDREALERTFHVTFARPDGDASDTWRLTLRPRTEALRSFLTEMRLDGRGQGVVRMVMTEASGDVTTTTFSDVRVGREFSARELRQLFRI